ncbi:MAG: energy transducer TonB [Candidatus Cloacimonetes bacterium]|nr:energy transducer TonB [Candidatus Cloacimonadota bacterium]
MTDIRKALIVSIGIHVLLILIGFFIYYEIIPEQLFRQIEILDFRMERIPVTRVTDYRPVRTIGEPAIRDFTEGQSTNLAPLRVDLPKVMTEFDDPLERIDTPRQQEVATTPIKLSDDIGNTMSRMKSSIAQDARDLDATRIQEQPLTAPGDDYLDHLASLIGGSSDSPTAYYLEGEILQRTIVKEVVPDYPAGLQRNATVTIQFSVYPDGSVADLIIIKRDEAILEELSLNSLAQWQFNSIPQNIIQKGQITFVYQLQ